MNITRRLLQLLLFYSNITFPVVFSCSFFKFISLTFTQNNLSSKLLRSRWKLWSGPISLLFLISTLFALQWWFLMDFQYLCWQTNKGRWSTPSTRRDCRSAAAPPPVPSCTHHQRAVRAHNKKITLAPIPYDSQQFHIIIFTYFR